MSPPRENDIYRTTSGALREVLIDMVTRDEVFLRVTDGAGGLLAARRLNIAEWERIRDSHELVRVTVEEVVS